MQKLTTEDLDVKGKKVLMRVDFNVPLKGGQVADDTRIRAAVPTIRYILGKGGRLVLMSHLGRPDGRRVAEMSMRPCIEVLEKQLGRAVLFCEECVGEKAEAAAGNLKAKTATLRWANSLSGYVASAAGERLASWVSACIEDLQ